MNENNPYQAPESEIITHQQTGDLRSRYASRGSRFGAAIIDTVIMTIAVLVPFGLLDFYDTDTFSFKGTFDNELLFALALFIVYMMIFMLVNGYFLYNSAQTVGKKILNIQVVDLSGQPISGNHYFFKRYLPVAVISNLPFLGGIFSLVNALLIFRDEHNCLHDDIAKTRVIQLNT